MKVLLAIDGSRFSDAAVDECTELLYNVKDAEVHVLTVIEPAIVTVGPLGAFPSYVGEVDEVLRSAAEKIASSANRKILRRIPTIGAGLTSRIAVGDPEKIILDEAEQCSAQVIIVGCSGSGFFEGARLGSVSDAVVRHAHCSVLVVRPPRYHSNEQLL